MKTLLQTAPKLLQQISHENIHLLTAASNYTYLELKGGDKVLSGYSLGFYENLLEDNFLRIGRSHLVNKAFITNVVRKDKVHFVKLKDKRELAIPRRKAALIISRFSKH